MATGQDTDVQELEIAKLKDTFEGQVKVIRGVRDFTNVVTLTPKDADLQVKFQLTAGYPSSTATVSVRSSDALTQEEVYALTTALQTEAQSLAGSQSIEAVMEACDKWIKGKSKSTEIGHLEQAAAKLNPFEVNEAYGKSVFTSCRTSEYKHRYQRPNYFLALRITDDECIYNFQDIQKVMSRQFPNYKDCAIPRNGFHITLSVARLETDADVVQCVSALKDIQSKMVAICKLTDPLEFRGLGSFGSNVVFAEGKSSPRLRLLVDTIQRHLAQSDVQGLSDRTFKAHMTLFNKSSSRTRQAYWPTQPPVLTQFAETYFGKQNVDNIHLCKMGSLTETSEFYTSVLSIDVKQFTP